MNEQFYENPNMQNQPYYQPDMRKPIGDGIGFGIASLVLGVLSVFMFGCCVNYIMAVLSIVFAVVQLVKNRSKGMAVAGIITSAISIILGTLLWVCVAINMDTSDWNSNFSEPYEFFEEESPFDNDYDQDTIDEL